MIYKKFSILLWINISLLVMITPSYVKSCGIYYLGEDYRIAFLNPYLIGADYASFFYSADYINHMVNAQNGSDRWRNCQDWATYMGGGITVTDVQKLLYESSLDDVLNAIEEGPEHPKLGENLFLKTLLSPQQKEVLDYLIFAKKYESASSTRQENPWSNDYYGEEIPAAISGFKQTALERIKTTKNDFLRQRYAYQIVVMSRYENDATTFNQYFDKYFAEQGSVLADWALHHKAGMVKDTTYSSYLYALSFNRCPEKNVASWQRFNKTHLNAILSHAKNEEEKAAVLALYESKNPGRSLENIQKIYQLSPHHKTLPLLLVREINKLEDWLFTHGLIGLGPAHYPHESIEEKWTWSEEQWATFRAKNLQKDEQYLAEFSLFLQKMASSAPKAKSFTALYHLLAAHVLLLQKNNSEATKHLALVKDSSNPVFQEQKATAEILLLLQTGDILAQEVQMKIAALLKTIEPQNHLNAKAIRDFQTLHLLISQAYLKKGAVPYAYFFNNHAIRIPTSFHQGSTYYNLIAFLDWQATEKDIDAILALIEKSDKNSFEKYLTDTPLPSKNALLDLRGTISFRQNHLEEALQAFTKVDNDFWQTKYYFHDYLVTSPFDLHIDSTHLFPTTKTELVQQMIQLEKESITVPEKAAENYLKLATAWYNFTYQGRSWMMLVYGRYSYEKSIDQNPVSYRPHDQKMIDIYYHSARCLEYLEKASSAAKNNQQQDIIAMTDYIKTNLAWRNFLNSSEDEYYNEGYEERIAEAKMGIYKKWTSRYHESAVYQDLLKNCPELADYF